MTKQEFLSSILEYYGNFSNEGIYKQFLKVLSRIADKDLEKLFGWFLENIPSNYRIDVKTLLDATKANFVSFVKEDKDKTKCPVCEYPIAKGLQKCPYCEYDYTMSAEEYKQIVRERAAKQLTKIFEPFVIKQAELKKELEKKEQGK